MAMIENCTDYPTAQVREIIRWCVAELGLSKRTGLLVRVRNTTRAGYPYSGRAYRRVRALSPRTRRAAAKRGATTFRPTIPKGVNSYALLRVWPEKWARYPHDGSAYRVRRGDPPPREVRSWQEALVVIAAHELQHHVQFGRPRVRGSVSEVECAWAEHRLLNSWRLRIGEVVR